MDTTHLDKEPDWATLMATGGALVEQEFLNIMSKLANAGIRIDVLQPNSSTEVFVAELPNGRQYLFLRVGLLKLRDEGKLNISGVEEFGVTR